MPGNPQEGIRGRGCAGHARRLPAAAQYTAPPPAPGFHYIFDGTATGSDASFDKWTFASSTAAQLGHGRASATLDAAEGTIRVGASPFGSYWYTPRPFGDAVFRIQYQIENTPTATPNGGIMVRAPVLRATRAPTPTPCSPRSRPASTTTSAAARSRSATAPRRARARRTTGPARPGPFPPAGEYTGALLRAPVAAGVVQRQRHQRPAR